MKPSITSQQELDFSYKAAMKFKTREEYFEFRKQWKQDYHDTVVKIRQIKRDLKTAQRTMPLIPAATWGFYYALNSARRDIQTLLKDRSWSKEEAQRQYEAQKEVAHG